MVDITHNPSRYSASPLIEVRRVAEISEDGVMQEDVHTEVPCCADCRRKRYASVHYQLKDIDSGFKQTRVFVNGDHRILA